MKKRTDTEIHYSDLLITLDYLLTNTDKDHPATQQKILEYAKEKYGLKYDKGATGNDIRRQSVAKCLKFLGDVAFSNPKYFPFILKKTDSGKYYIEKRHGLDETQIAKILAALSNDKYTNINDQLDLKEKVLNAFASEYNRKEIETESNRMCKGVKKYSGIIARNIDLIDKAYRERKMIKVDIGNVSTSSYAWCKVYLIKEFCSKPYVFMLPITKGVNGYTFEPIERIKIPKLDLKDILADDMDPDRDFNKLFSQKCPALAKKYGTLDKALEQEILPKQGNNRVVSFSFDLSYKDAIKKSFENFFLESFRYQEINNIAAVKKLYKDTFSFSFVTHESKKNESSKKGLVNICVDEKSFKSWLLSDPYGNGSECIADKVKITKPASINRDLAAYFFTKFYSRIDSLDSITDAQKEEFKKMYENKYNEEKLFPKLDEAYDKKESLHLVGSARAIYNTVECWLGKTTRKFNRVIINFEQFLDIAENEPFFSSKEIDKLASLPDLVIVVKNYLALDENRKKQIFLLENGCVVDDREDCGYRKLKNVRSVFVIEDEIVEVDLSE